MNSFKNVSFCILFPLMLFGGLPDTGDNNTIRPDDYDIVVVSDSQGGHAPDDICSISFKISKSPTAPMPKSIELKMSVNSPSFNTDYTFTVDNLADLTNIYVSTNPYEDHHGYLVLNDFFSGHIDRCSIDYSMTVYTDEGNGTWEGYNTLKVPGPCYPSD